MRSSVISPGFISDSGMFSEYDTKAHWVAGESKPESVGEAVVAALTRDKAELIVSPGPIKLMLLLDAMSPSLTSWFFRRIGLYQFYRKLAELVEARPD